MEQIDSMEKNKQYIAQTNGRCSTRAIYFNYGENVIETNETGRRSPVDHLDPIYISTLIHFLATSYRWLFQEHVGC